MPFHPLVTTVIPPAELNSPFDYVPHRLTLLAADAVRQHLAECRASCKSDSACWDFRSPDAEGKMFGVLVCSDAEGRIGFLAAYSGQIGGRADWPWFVPAVFDYLQPDGYFKQEEARITDINRRVVALEHDARYVQYMADMQQLCQQAEAEIADYQTLMREAKRQRDERRGAKSETTEADEAAMIRESQFQKAELRRIKRRWAAAKEQLQAHWQPIQAAIDALKAERRQRSDALQRWLFDRFVMRNEQGEGRTLTDIFATTPQRVPPSGAGECCAPKLFQYALLHHLKPLCIGEFWQGPSPKMEIRHHDQFYPACRGKCKPILEWMLCRRSCTQPGWRGIATQSPKIVYEDDCLLVVDKPSGLLSVPGLIDQPSVESLLRRNHSEVYMVHRLDMDTSGLMVVALTQESYHHLQRQFLTHTIYKRYEALLDGCPASSSGTIALSLRPDPLDRPRQVVDHKHGKTAITEYQVISVGGDLQSPAPIVGGDLQSPTPIVGGDLQSPTRILLTPHTGRTHQLRVHCAHAEGLAVPIVGDNLYGHPNGGRLCLHATTLAFTHPKTGRRLQFESPAPF